MLNALALAIPVAFFLAIAAAGCYVDVRLRTSFGKVSQKRHKVLAAALSVGSVAIVGATSTSASKAAGISYVAAGHAFSFFLYLLLAIGLLHLIQFVLRIPQGLAAVAAIGVALGATTAGALRAQTFSVTETQVSLPGLKQELRVMQLSDVHLGHHRGGEYLAQLVEETNRHKPDLVLITGDLIDSNAALDAKTFAPLSALQAPTYYVGGNHEITIDNSRALELIGSNGVRILRNETVMTHGIQLVGLDYMKADEQTFDMHPSKDVRTVQKTIDSMYLRNDVPSVLMEHSPVGVNHLSKAGIDLVVAGHTHAGQLFPATLITRFIFPFNTGLYVYGNTQVFVSPGAGTFLQKNRLGSTNEINLLTLKGSNG